MSLTSPSLPAVRQRDHSDCGPAVVLSALRYFGGDWPLADLRRISGTTASGTTLAGLVRAASVVGLVGEAAHGTLEELLADGRTPFVAHMMRGGRLHFILVYRVDAGEVTAADPALGLVRMTLGSFQEGWTGFVLFLSDAGGARTRPTTRMAGWIGGHLSSLGPWIQQAMFLGVVYSTVAVMLALFIQALLDSLLPSGDLGRILYFGGALLLVSLVQAAIGLLRQVFVLEVSRRLGRSVGGEVLGRIFRLPHDFFATRTIGDITARAHDTGRIQSATSDVLGLVALDGTVVVISLVATFFIAPRLALVAALLVPFYAALLALTAARLQDRQRRVMATFAETESFYLNLFPAHEEIRLLGWVEYAEARVMGSFGRLQDETNALGRATATLAATSQVAGSLLTVSVLCVGGMQVVRSGLTVGAMIAAYSLVSGIVSSVSRVVGASVSVQGAKVAIERLGDLLDVSPEEVRTGEDVPGIERLTLRDVGFTWPSGVRLFEEVNCELGCGINALAGSNGVGKSTLVRVLTSQYQPTTGTVLADGRPVGSLSLDGYRARVALVPEETSIFCATVGENLVADEAWDPDEVRGKLETAGLWCLFQRSRLGLDRPVGERGEALSAGERQLLGLARAVLTEPSVLILDESLAVLDVGMRVGVLEALRAWSRDRVVILVSHHLDQLRAADRLFVLRSQGIESIGSVTAWSDHDLVDVLT